MHEFDPGRPSTLEDHLVTNACGTTVRLGCPSTGEDRCGTPKPLPSRHRISVTAAPRHSSNNWPLGVRYVGMPMTRAASTAADATGCASGGLDEQRSAVAAVRRVAGPCQSSISGTSPVPRRNAQAASPDSRANYSQSRRWPARPDHQVDTRSTAENSAHRHRDLPAIRGGVGLGLEVPVTFAAEVAWPLVRLDDARTSSLPPASSSNTLTFGFSASRRAITDPRIPPRRR